VTLVVVREDMLSGARGPARDAWHTTFTSKNSLYNTPPCFAIYAVQLVLKWIEETVGGLEKMAAVNHAKAERLYQCIDASAGFFRGTAETDSRSQMNVTFRLANEDLEKRFLDEAAKNGLGGLKGHRSLGGCRASLYNAVSLEAVDALVDVMKTFPKKNG
jgi:phosphoserine aminotransferase